MMGWYGKVAKRDEAVAKIEQLKSLTERIGKAIRTLETCKVVEMESDSNDSKWYFENQFIDEFDLKIKSAIAECINAKALCARQLECENSKFEKLG